jgi:hypothetical protein
LYDSGPGIVDLFEGSSTSESVILRRIMENETKGTYGIVRKDVVVRAATLLDSILKGRLSMEKVKSVINDDDQFLKELMMIASRKEHVGKLSVERALKKTCLRKVRAINDLHEARPETRFASVAQSSANELYMLATFGEQEIYTSSFNGIFDRMLARMQERHTDGATLLRNMGDVRFRTFFKMCVSYDRLDDFLGTMTEPEQKALVVRFTKGLDREGGGMLEQSVIVAEALSMMRNPKLAAIARAAIRSEYERTGKEGKTDARRLYGLLAGLFGKDVAVNDAWYAEMAKRYSLPSISKIDSKDLVDSKGRNTQRYHFYGDEDGKASFRHFLGQYTNDKRWKVEEHESYIVIRSNGAVVPIDIYVNKPVADSGENDLDNHFKKEGLKEKVFVHRGHSFHADDSIRDITNESAIVALGSCGGYSNLAKILDKSPEAHIISTKGTGTMLVNDRYLKKLNEWISEGKSIDWNTFWGELEEEMGNSPDFRKYVPPHKNFGMIFLKAYRSLIQSEMKEVSEEEFSLESLGEDVSRVTQELLYTMQEAIKSVMKKK